MQASVAQEIAAIVEDEDSPEVKRWRVLAEIDENLIRRDLTAAQRARLVSKRKAAYEAVHPETKHGATGRRGRKDANLASFADDTAAKSGKSVRAVVRDATRAKALGSDLDRVAGTSLGQGSKRGVAIAASRAVADGTLMLRTADDAGRPVTQS